MSSFTFKGMLSSLSRSDSAKSEINHNDTVTTESDKHAASGHSQVNGGNLNGWDHRAPTPSEEEANGCGQLAAPKGPKRSLSKRGKKKLSAMINKLNNSISSSKFKSTSQEKTTHSNNNHIEIDSDEDEIFCEPLCQDGFDSLADQHPETKSKSNSAVKQLDRQGSSENDKGCEERDEEAAFMPEEQCDIPTFLHTKDCDKQLIETTRLLLRERYAKNPDNFYADDYKRMLEDDWTVSRFLLRRRLDPKRTAKLMEECGRFRIQYKMSEVKLWEFPIEFHKAGGLFKYAKDRVGNLTVYMRVKMYRRVPEISDVFKAFILCVLEEADVENGGRGVAVVFDLTGCGLQNVDLSFLSWLLSSFRNYCPKGVSYIVVYNLPWILSTTCRLAMTWMSATNRRALRFVHGDEIENFIAKENLPDYIGGTCKINYRAIPEGARPATEVCAQLDISPEQALKIRELFEEYLSDGEEDDDNGGEDDLGKKNKNKKQNKHKNKNKKQESKPLADANSKQDYANKDCDTSNETQEPSSLRTTEIIRQDLSQSADFVSHASKFIA